MDINCGSCRHNCEGEDRIECLQEFNTVWWSPKDESFCDDCPMWATLASGTIKCVRHAEPCWKNPLFYDPKHWSQFLKDYKNRFD